MKSFFVFIIYLIEGFLSSFGRGRVLFFFGGGGGGLNVGRKNTGSNLEGISTTGRTFE